MDASSDLRRAKSAVRAALAGRSDVVGVGIGDGVVRVYVRDPAAARELAARDFGVRVQFVVTGDVRASDGSDSNPSAT